MELNLQAMELLANWKELLTLEKLRAGAGSKSIEKVT